MTHRSRTHDLIREARRYLNASVAPAAALVIQRLKDPVAPDAVVWHATAVELDRQGYDVRDMGDQYDADPSLVGSLLEASDHYAAPSEVVA